MELLKFCYNHRLGSLRADAHPKARPQPPKRKPLFASIGHVLFPLESPPYAHPD